MCLPVSAQFLHFTAFLRGWKKSSTETSRICEKIPGRFGLAGCQVSALSKLCKSMLRKWRAQFSFSLLAGWHSKPAMYRSLCNSNYHDCLCTRLSNFCLAIWRPGLGHKNLYLFCSYVCRFQGIWFAIIVSFSSWFLSFFAMRLDNLDCRSCMADCERKNPDCPVCNENLNILASSLPFAHCSQSRLVCYMSGEPMNESNPPRMLPNGYVYGEKVLASVVLAEQLLTDFSF